MPHSPSRGQQICRQFYREVIRPALDRSFTEIPHAAALLGRGSEVQGLDDPMSADHNFEARVTLLLADADHERCGEQIDRTLQAALPSEFAGRRTEIQVLTVDRVLRTIIGLDTPPTAQDWLTLNENNLRMLTLGPVFHDDIGLREVLHGFDYYPHDIWLYLMIAAWWRVHPEVNQIGRTGFVGDELGSSLIGSRLVSELMRLCFLLERQYAPYPKWFGTAFSRLECAPQLTPLLTRVLESPNWHAREEALLDCYRQVATMHERLAITRSVPTEIEQLWDRPFRVWWGDFPAALREAITDPEVIAIADRWPVGGPDAVRETLSAPRFRPQLATLVG